MDLEFFNNLKNSVKENKVLNYRQKTEQILEKNRLVQETSLEDNQTETQEPKQEWHIEKKWGNT